MQGEVLVTMNSSHALENNQDKGQETTKPSLNHESIVYSSSWCLQALSTKVSSLQCPTSITVMSLYWMGPC